MKKNSYIGLFVVYKDIHKISIKWIDKNAKINVKILISNRKRVSYFHFHRAPQFQLKRSERVQYFLSVRTHVDPQGWKNTINQ